MGYLRGEIHEKCVWLLEPECTGGVGHVRSTHDNRRIRIIRSFCGHFWSTPSLLWELDSNTHFGWKYAFKLLVSPSAGRMVVIWYHKAARSFFIGFIFEPGFNFSRPAEFCCKWTRISPPACVFYCFLQAFTLLYNFLQAVTPLYSFLQLWMIR